MSYKYHTIHIDNQHHSSDKTLQTSWVSELLVPLHSVVQVSIIKINFNQSANVEGVPYVHVCIDELRSIFNEISGVAADSTSITQEIIPNGKSQVRGCLAIIDNRPHNVCASSDDDRTNYFGSDYSTQTQFLKPIDQLDKLTISVRDPYGDLVTRNGSDTNNRNLIQISLRFTCLAGEVGKRKVSKNV